MLTLQSQTMFFLGSCLLGMCLGIVYDIFRISRLAVKTCNIIIFIEDLLFFIIVTISSFVYLIANNEGVMRGFLLIGELLGAILYFSSLSIAIMKAAQNIINAVKAFFIFLYKLTIKPIIRLFLFIFKISKKIYHLIIKKIKFKKVKIDNNDTLIEGNLNKI